MKNRYKLLVAYDGTQYGGWQYQHHDVTVSGTLQSTFQKIFDHDAHILGASRTDAGVHALGQVALLKTDLAINPERLLKAWNAKLPPSIALRGIEKLSDDFYPLNNVLQKTYWYHFTVGQRSLPFVAPYVYDFEYSVDIEKLKIILPLFKGTHDFRSYCSGNDLVDTVRTIDDIRLEYIKRYRVYRIIVQGPSFLRYMIRRIVGASLEVASRTHLPVEEVIRVMAEKDAEQILPKAPACGLVLRKILYHSSNL